MEKRFAKRSIKRYFVKDANRILFLIRISVGMNLNAIIAGRLISLFVNNAI